MTTIQQIRAAIGRASAARDSLTKLQDQERGIERELEPARRAAAEAEPKLDHALAAQRLDGGSAAATKRANDTLQAAQLALREITASLAVVRERIAKADAEAERLEAEANRQAREIGETAAVPLLDEVRATAAELGRKLVAWYWLAGAPTGSNQQLAPRGHDLGRVLYESGVRCLEGTLSVGDPNGYDIPNAAKILDLLERYGDIEPEAKAAE
jgi:hypothetical protein